MFRKILTAALFAGLLAGLGVTAVQTVTTTPLILAAEAYEDGTADADQHAEAAWAPEDGLERTLSTGLSNLVVGVGYGLILTAAFALYGGPVDGRRGVVWGLGGFATFALAPGLGLPPELPGMMAAELGARQGWWLFCAAATGVGLAALVFGKTWVWRAAGLLALITPHAIGAPHPGNVAGPVPPELAAHFAAASLATGAIFWSLLGWLSGTLWARENQVD